MPWPPQAADFKTENIELCQYLSMFLNSLVSGKVSMQSSERVNRLRLSVGQDLLYAISNGTLRTPKSILFPYMIKTFTNCKELIRITNRLDHGVSYSILEKMETENAYKVLSEMKEDCVLPLECKEEVFTMMIADNIDRNEELLSGKFSQNMKGKSLTYSLLYISYIFDDNTKFATEVAKFEFSLEIYLAIR